MEPIVIRDLSLPALKPYLRLTQPKTERQGGVFIAEGAEVIKAALDAGIRPVSLLTEKKHITGKAKPLIDRMPGIPVYTGESGILQELTGFPLTRGLLCAMEQPVPRTVGEVCEGASRIAVAEDLADGSNLGALFRNAAALGMDAVLLSPGCCDPLSRKAIRVSMGTVFRIPYAIPDLPGGSTLPELLRSAGFLTAALALDRRAVPIREARLDRIPRLALFLGNEGTGLKPETVQACDRTVIIPMRRGVDSLNVSAAAAIAFEAACTPGIPAGVHS